MGTHFQPRREERKGEPARSFYVVGGKERKNGMASGKTFLLKKRRKNKAPFLATNRAKGGEVDWQFVFFFFLSFTSLNH